MRLFRLKNTNTEKINLPGANREILLPGRTSDEQFTAKEVAEIAEELAILGVIPIPGSDAQELGAPTPEETEVAQTTSLEATLHSIATTSAEVKGGSVVVHGAEDVNDRSISTPAKTALMPVGKLSETPKITRPRQVIRNRLYYLDPARLGNKIPEGYTLIINVSGQEISPVKGGLILRWDANKRLTAERITQLARIAVLGMRGKGEKTLVIAGDQAAAAICVLAVREWLGLSPSATSGLLTKAFPKSVLCDEHVQFLLENYRPT